MLQIGGKEFNITEDLIAAITSFSTEGRRFYRDKNESGPGMDIFFKDDERRKLERVKCDGYYRTSVKAIWRDVTKEIMRYFTLWPILCYL